MLFRLGELFCGPGGLGLGAKMAAVSGAGISHVWATDSDRDSCRTYENNLNPQKTICEDIRGLDFGKLKSIGDVDALSFGFPCNDFSVVGKKNGVAGGFGALYTYCVEAVAYFRPKWFFAENVGGIRSADEGNTLEAILKAFMECGYKTYPHLYSFDNYGVPQRRKRVIIVGIRDDFPMDFNIPSPAPFKNTDISAKHALRKISNSAFNNELTAQSKTVIERLEHIKPGQNAFTADLPENLRLNINGAKISLIYRRLHPDKPAYTITGSGGGGTHVYHWDEPRALTNRERARLQSFPDNFIFCGHKESVRKQVGMAVPPRGARVIFESILKSFIGKKYASVSANMQIPALPVAENF
ncbi:MAG: DNA cytosine methyltransferase [Gammaproteobacteria bacterium]